jgi:zinc protease
MHVVVVMHHEQPAVNLRLIIGAGSAYDPTGRNGVAAFTGALLDQGTTSRSATGIADGIDSIGGFLDVGAGTDLSFVNVLVMTDSFEFGMELVAESARRPSFAPAELERQRQQVLSQFQVSYDDPAYVAGAVLSRLIYGFHPYGMPASGTPESVRQITRDDLLAFHAAHYAPNNAWMAIVGDVDAESAFAAAERVFGDWTPRTAAAAPPDGQIPEPTRRVVVIDKPGSLQTAIRVGHAALSRTSPDHMPFDVAIKILGGEGGNRLGSVLRTERALTYSASAEISSGRYGGDFVGKTDTRTEATVEALRLMVGEVGRLRRERVSRRELENAQAYLAGNFPLTIETPNAIAAQVLESLVYGLDLEDLPTYPNRINAVSVEDIRRAARTYLQPDRLAIVLVGEARAFVDGLRRAGFGNIEVLSVAELDLSSPDLRR